MRPGAVANPDVGQLRRRRADEGGARTNAAAVDLVERREEVAALGQLLERAVLDRDPPQLVGAVPRREERQPAAVGRRDQPRPFARRDVAVHRRARHDVVPVGQVRAAAGRRLGAVGGEEPDVVAVAVGGDPSAERRDRRAVGQPRRDEERRLRAAGDAGADAGRDVDDDDVRPELEVVVAIELRREGDARAIGRPGRVVVAGRAVGQARRLARGDVDDPEMGDVVVDEPRPVEHVAQPVDVAVVRLGRVARLALLVEAASLPVVLAVRPVGRRDDDELRAVGRPLEAVDAARQIGQPAGLATVQGEQVDLAAVLAILLVTGVRLLLDQVPAVRDERDRPTVRRPAGVAVVLRAERQLARLAAVAAVAVERHEPDRVAVAVALRGSGLERDQGVAAVRRDARVGRDAELVQVVGGERSRHEILRRSAAGLRGAMQARRRGRV